MQTVTKQYPPRALEPAIEHAPNKLNTNPSINPSQQQQQQCNLPVADQPFSPLSPFCIVPIPACSGHPVRHLGPEPICSPGPRQFKACISNSLSSRIRAMILSLYSALVRQHLQYWVQFCTSPSKKHIEGLESIREGHKAGMRS